ncbi:MAG: hypothetical protein AAF939_05765 [Planctomycetota bacterium]
MNSFPIKLKAFEEYFLHNRLGNNPALFTVKLGFNQPLQKNLVQQTHQIICNRHPFSKCIVESRAGQPVWVEKGISPVKWEENSVSEASVSLDCRSITKEPGIRVFACTGVQETPSRGSLLFLVHHVAIDGIGMAQWLNDWLRCYRKLQNSSFDAASKKFPPLQVSLLRCQPQVQFREWLRLLPAQWKSVRSAYRVMTRKVIPLSSSKIEDGDSRPILLETEFDARTSTQLKQAANNNRVSLNTLLVRDLFIAVDAWQQKRNEEPDSPPGYVRMVIPINERDRAYRKQAACNHCTMISLDRTRQDIDAPEELLRTIDHELGVIRDWRLSLNCWRFLELFRRLPGGLEKRLNSSQVSATISFTNIGRFLPRLTTQKEADTGNQIGFDQIVIYPPLAHGLMGAFAAINFKNRLKISARLDSNFIAPASAQQLMMDFKNQLLSNL